MSFYNDLGWRLDEFVVGEAFRGLQFSPPGSLTAFKVSLCNPAAFDFPRNPGHCVEPPARRDEEILRHTLLALPETLDQDHRFTPI